MNDKLSLRKPASEKAGMRTLAPGGRNMKEYRRRQAGETG